jgi:hypothetical protein
MAEKLKCNIIDYSKEGLHYKNKKWLAMEEKQKLCKGKTKKWRAATGKDFTEVKKGILVYGGSPVIVNDKYGACDYNTKDGKHCMTSTFVTGMRDDVFGNFKVIKQSDGKTTNKLLR